MALARRLPVVETVAAPAEPTTHVLRLGDARAMDWLGDESIHLAVTSPPYWTLKKYNDNPDQLGDLADYESFLDELDKVWAHILRALVPGGRLVLVVGDVCLSRRKNKGRHQVIPLHADISVRARRLGFDYLTPIYWQKISNASYEVERGSGGGFLGKPFEPNAVIKNDTEYILFLRKPGGYRKPTEDQRLRSKLTKEEHSAWFRSAWMDVPGASTREHPAPFPLELANRLVRMFSFVGDTVLDPFLGTGTTSLAAIQADRNSIGVEIDPQYLAMAEARIHTTADQITLFGADRPSLTVIRS